MRRRTDAGGNLHNSSCRDLLVIVLLVLIIPFAANTTVVDAASSCRNERDSVSSRQAQPPAPDEHGVLTVQDGTFSSVKGSSEGHSSKRLAGPTSLLPVFKQAEEAAGIATQHAAVDVHHWAADDACNTVTTASVSSSTTPSDSGATPPRTPPTAGSSRVSAVLVLTLKDARLSTLLITTLRACGAMALFRDFFVVVPGAELAQIEAVICNRVGNDSIGEKSPGLPS